MHVSVICLIGICFGHGDDHDAEAEVELPVQKPPFDDGQVNAEVDLPADCRTPETWSNCSTWTCSGEHWELNLNANETTRKVDQKADFGGHKSDMIDQHQGKTALLCPCVTLLAEELYPNSNYPNGIPASGYHRPKWPEYGEYRWIPPLRYVHSLEHGAMLFMYHPCAPIELVQARVLQI